MFGEKGGRPTDNYKRKQRARWWQKSALAGGYSVRERGYLCQNIWKKWMGHILLASFSSDIQSLQGDFNPGLKLIQESVGLTNP